MESFKRNILQSIQDEDAMPGGGLGLGGGYSSAPPPALPSTTDYTPAAPPAAPTPGYTRDASPGRGYVSASPAVPPAAGSPGGGAGADASAAAVMDGKDFFRQARLRLSYEQFNQFLSNIKRLNDHAQTRDETLARAQEIFGAENGDLFNSFKTLLSKHGLT